MGTNDAAPSRSEAPYSPSLVRILHAAVSDFLRGVGKATESPLECRYDCESAPTSVLLGTIGLGGKNIQGTLSLQVSDQFLIDTDPLKRTELSPSDQAEWIGEMINRVAGSIKGSITTYGVALEIGLPAVVSGKDVALAKSHLAPSLSLLYADGTVTFHLLFCAVISSHVTFDGEPDLDAVIGGAGLATLF